MLGMKVCYCHHTSSRAALIGSSPKADSAMIRELDNIRAEPRIGPEAAQAFVALINGEEETYPLEADPNIERRFPSNGL